MRYASLWRRYPMDFVIEAKLNIFFSMLYNVVRLTLGSLGMLTPVLAVIFQEAGCVTVVLSSTLLLWAKPGSNSQ